MTASELTRSHTISHRSIFTLEKKNIHLYLYTVHLCITMVTIVEHLVAQVFPLRVDSRSKEKVILSMHSSDGHEKSLNECLFLHV